MINQDLFVQTLKGMGVEFFTGVPDSYLNSFCNCLGNNIPKNKHVIAANEGNALSMAAGYYFNTNTMPLVYMQNSGLGNVINPLASLTDKNVYKVPLVLLIGWRGEPGTGDHAQHITQGKITTRILEMLDIPYIIAEDDDALLMTQVKPLLSEAKNKRQPVAILAPKGVFATNEKDNLTDESYPLCREEAIELILDSFPEDTIYVATTGRATRELYFLREARNEDHQNDLLNLGAMGHASSIAMGLALANKNRRVVCLDGDASALMHMGSFGIAGNLGLHNFTHIVLNNGAHESVGGQPSVGYGMDFTAIAAGSGYSTVGHPVKEKDELDAAIAELMAKSNTSFIDFRIRKGLKHALPPLDIVPNDLIDNFMQEIIDK